MELRIFRVVVMVNLLVEMNQSAIMERRRDAIHMPRYGTELRMPFCGENSELNLTVFGEV
jgi:hypothetical protein